MSDNGGPAFPYTNIPDEFDPVVQKSGMSLRDYFAAKAMQELMAAAFADVEAQSAARFIDERAQKAGAKPYDAIAELAYQMADAMLKAREQ